MLASPIHLLAANKLLFEKFGVITLVTAQPKPSFSDFRFIDPCWMIQLSREPSPDLLRQQSVNLQSGKRLFIDRVVDLCWHGSLGREPLVIKDHIRTKLLHYETDRDYRQMHKPSSEHMPFLNLLRNCTDGRQIHLPPVAGKQFRSLQVPTLIWVGLCSDDILSLSTTDPVLFPCIWGRREAVTVKADRFIDAYFYNLLRSEIKCRVDPLTNPVTKLRKAWADYVSKWTGLVLGTRNTILDRYFNALQLERFALLLEQSRVPFERETSFGQHHNVSRKHYIAPASLTEAKQFLQLTPEYILNLVAKTQQ